MKKYPIGFPACAVPRRRNLPPLLHHHHPPHPPRRQLPLRQTGWPASKMILSQPPRFRLNKTWIGASAPARPSISTTWIQNPNRPPLAHHPTGSHPLEAANLPPRTIAVLIQPQLHQTAQIGSNPWHPPARNQPPLSLLRRFLLLLAPLPVIRQTGFPVFLPLSPP